MNDIYPFFIFTSVMLVMASLFFLVFIIIARYLVSVHNLNKQIKKNEPLLWTDLGQPETFAFLHKTFNPFKALHAQMKFCNWFLKGGEGATEPATIELVDKSKRLFKKSMIWFVSLFAIYGIIITGMFIFFSFVHHYDKIKQERDDAFAALRQHSEPHKVNGKSITNNVEFKILSKNIYTGASVNDSVDIFAAVTFDDGEEPLIADKLELTVLQNAKIENIRYDDKGNASVVFALPQKDLKSISLGKEKGELLIKKAALSLGNKDADYDAFEAHIRQYVKERKQE